MSDRFYVKEHSGYPIRPGISGSGGARRSGTIEVLVLDRAYCHLVVWSSWWRSGPRGRNSPNAIAKDRRDAASLCAQWNAEDQNAEPAANPAKATTGSDKENLHA